eukprot:4470394-Pleurochrysis_carterae.AAC.1
MQIGGPRRLRLRSRQGDTGHEGGAECACLITRSESVRATSAYHRACMCASMRAYTCAFNCVCMLESASGGRYGCGHRNGCERCREIASRPWCYYARFRN